MYLLYVHTGRRRRGIWKRLLERDNLSVIEEILQLDINWFIIFTSRKVKVALK